MRTRRKLPVLFGATLVAFAVSACEGPQGPEGPMGPTGEPGPTGPAGESTTEPCSACHSNSATIVAIEDQYAVSVHGTYTSFGRDTNPCNTCHTHQGFLASLDGGSIDNVAQPARVNCRTCHQIHTTYGAEDYALTVSDPVDLIFSGNTVDFGAGNLCATCHQARVPATVPAVGEGGQSEVPARFGTHHGPQATVFAAGAGLPVFPGSASVPTGLFTAHVTFGGSERLACVGCHMQEPVGDQAGGHVWEMTDGSGDVVDDGTCATCHSDATAELVEAVAEVQPLLDDLAACLVAEGVMSESGSPNAGAVVDDDLLAGFLIWQTVTEDGSYSAHHPSYVPAILSNANEYLDANYPACAP
ncbi:MAG: hypothetical protein ACOC5I_00575 [Gemmatimonadota bacterium]